MSLRPKRIQFHQVWPQLQLNIEELYKRHQLGTPSAMDMLQDVYQLCVAFPKPLVEPLFCALAQLLQEHAGSVVQKLQETPDLLAVYATEWIHYSRATQSLNGICDYMNRLIATGKISLPSQLNNQGFRLELNQGSRGFTVEILSMEIWKQLVVKQLTVNGRSKLVQQLLKDIDAERECDQQVTAAVDGAGESIRVTIASLVAVNAHHTEEPLKLYQDLFEMEFLSGTREYCQREASQSMSELSTTDYVKKAFLKLKEEEQRCRRYCHETTLPKLLSECETAWIVSCCLRLQGEFENFLQKQQFDDLSRLFDLLSRVKDGINPLVSTFEKYIVERGKERLQTIATSTKESMTTIEEVIKLLTSFTQLVQVSFRQNVQFDAALDKAFRSIVNNSKLISNPSEALARFCDLYLKRGTKMALSEAELDGKMNLIVSLFKYIDDKDMFQKYYSRHLAKRFIFGTSLSEEAESSMISRLKIACGLEYTSKLHRMFTDMSLNEGLNQQFAEFLGQSNTNLTADFHALVLTAGSWPLSPQTALEFTIPSDIATSFQAFELFYGKRYSGRKISWLHHLSKADIRMNGFDKRYEIGVSAFQASIVLAFNSTDELELSKLSEITKLTPEEIQRCIGPLIDLQLFSLREQILCLNLNFQNKRTKVKVSSSAQTETPQEAENTKKSVDDDRKLYIQAIIVRIMKSRQQLTHVQLIQQTIDHAKSRFTPSIPMIKKCIELLLDKQYIERSSESGDKYVYVA